MKKNLDPVSFFGLTGKLKKIPRTGWIQHGLINVESIAEHSFRVSIMAYLLAKDLGCDSSKLIKMALVHDLAEVLTGDIVFEHGFDINLKKKLEKRMSEKEAIKQISALVGNGPEISKLWLDFTDKKSKEADLLKQIDKLEMAVQALEYENPRNPNHLREFWENSKMHIKHPILLNMFKELCKRRTPPLNSFDMIGKRFL
jgi:putative hydrolase of HD superfamily